MHQSVSEKFTFYANDENRVLVGEQLTEKRGLKLSIGILVTKCCKDIEKDKMRDNRVH